MDSWSKIAAGGFFGSLKYEDLFPTNLLLDVECPIPYPYVSLPLATFGGAGVTNFSIEG
ncbi:LOW QUALITY PROTEIN: hypothetical protein TorRG33x02_144910 [Trema orientale]|uniref:Uncharacterized protein n=1 Tax=Trema orientale TaxID=63057 RepID=A0A2P5EVU0_TREOI|nr:LOW QUALITY PROTEIN: hypothetical protein TorRG33x02_144910 [Trema orientale]